MSPKPPSQPRPRKKEAPSPCPIASTPAAPRPASHQARAPAAGGLSPIFPLQPGRYAQLPAVFSGPQGPAVQGGLLRLWPGGQLELRFGAPEPPRQEDLPTLLAKSFLQSVAGGLRASALLALSQNLLACVDFDGLRAFLGPFSGFETARFVPPGEGGLTLAVYQDEGPGRCLRRLRLLSFDFVNQQGDLRIDDLRAYV